MRTIQYINEGKLIAAKVVDADTVQPIKIEGGIIAAAQKAIEEEVSLIDWINAHLEQEQESYQMIVDDGRLMPPMTHSDPAKCLVSGTGLTHLGSADTRANMHAEMSDSAESQLTDSMKMFKLGVEGGKPAQGEVGALPEWFYKGDGYTIVAPGSSIPAHGFSLDAGEEPELVGLYIIGNDKKPYRVGFALGNEFSDHVTEKGNYLWLAHSKLQYSSFGPELLIGDLPESLTGQSVIHRDDAVVWEKEFLTGEANMSHAISNLEHHHFKYSQFCQPGHMHVHYFGTSTLSFADGFTTKEGDAFEVSIPEFGRSLFNPISRDLDAGLITVSVL